MRRVLIIGGSGVFGQRLAEGLRRTTSAEIILAGRSLARVTKVAASLGARGVALDRDEVTASKIATLSPNIVIDAAGPFQGSHLRLAHATLGAGAHYLDLSDARGFVGRIGELDEVAKAAGRVALSGASSTPALSHAALDAMCAGWRRIDVIRAGIAPGNQAPRGRSLVEAILNWAGKPIRVFESGAWRSRAGWSDCGTIGIEGLGRRRFALAETPDLDLFPARFATRDAALFMAALELPLLHRGLSFISWLRRAGLWRTPSRAAGLFTLLARSSASFGSECGGMIVEALGRDADDQPCRARWTLIAPVGQGPYVPTLPALALTRALLAGHDIESGACACVGVLKLADVDADFQHHQITTQITRARLVSPFEKALGDDFERAPASVRRAHRSGPVARFRGEAQVEGSANLGGALVAAVNGFPKAIENTPVRVTKRLGEGDVEIWVRDFGGRRFQSHLRCPRPGVVEETFGPFQFEMKVWANEGELGMKVIGWRLGHLPLPAFLAPSSKAVETQDSFGRFHFDVPIGLPLLGRITHYRGHLVADES